MTPCLDDPLRSRSRAALDIAVKQLADAKVTLEEAAKLVCPQFPSVANNIINQCAIRCADALVKIDTLML